MKYLSIFEEFLSNFLIRESVVAFSKDFKNVLIRMKNPIATEILKFEGQDKPVVNNYFDLKSDSNDAITFITDRKYKEILDKSNYGKYKIRRFDVLNPVEGNAKHYAQLGMELPTEVKPIPEGEVGKIERMWTSAGSGKTWAKFVADNPDYQPIMTNLLNLEKMWDDDIFFKSNRQDTRIGRGIRSFLTSVGLKFSDKEIESFVNGWKSTVDAINDIFSNFEIVSGEEIAKWYSFKHYSENKGTLGSSCMKGVNPDFFEIYTSNKKIEMVIFKDVDNPNKIAGRALLWTFDDGKKFMDRVYTVRDSDVQLFRDYAQKIGAYSKFSNNSNSSLESISPTGERVNLGVVNIQLSKISFTYYPYMDTFKLYKPDSGIISNNENSREGIWLESTEGGPENEDNDDNNMIYVEFYGNDIDLDDLVYCEFCEEGRHGPVEGYRYPDDCFFSRHYRVYVANSYSENYGHICHATNQWRLEDDMVKIYSLDDKWIVSGYSSTSGDYLYSIFHDQFIPKDIAVSVWTDSSKNKSDWRANDDESWIEVNGEKFDKNIEIRESFIKKFSNKI